MSWLRCGTRLCGHGSLGFRLLNRGRRFKLNSRGRRSSRHRLPLKCRQSFNCGRSRFLKEGSYERFFSGLFDLEVKRLFRRRTRGGLGVPPAHHGRVEAFFDYLSGAGLDDSLAPQNGGPMGLFVQVGLDPIALLLAEQAGIGVCVAEPEASAALQNVSDCNAPFIGKCLDSLPRSHLNHTIRAPVFYPVAP